MYISWKVEVLPIDVAAPLFSFVPARYASAKAVVKNVLKHYIEGTEGTVEDFILGNEYYDGSFKIRNLSTYASEIKQLDANQESILASVTRKVNQ